MPANLMPASPTDVMPAVLCRAFNEKLSFEALYNTYPDGSSDRLALVENTRHYFQFTPILAASDFAALRSFFNAHLGVPFWFYNLRETVPPYTWDGTGSSLSGRYAVVFDGQWSDQVGPARGIIIIPDMRLSGTRLATHCHPHVRSTWVENGTTVFVECCRRAAVPLRQESPVRGRLQRPESSLRAGAGRVRSIPLHAADPGQFSGHGCNLPVREPDRAV